MRAFHLGIVLASAAGFLICVGLGRADFVVSSPDIGILISPGNAVAAKAYYKRIAPKLGVKDTEKDLSTLTFLLNHFGVKQTAEQFELATPSELMTAFPNDQILASRFFAPKIVDFNSPGKDPKQPFKAGWRKLVRIVALPGSNAEKAGLAAVYILFNYVQQNPNDNPFPDAKFKVESFNTQAIIVPKNFKKGEEDSAFFLDYASRKEKYKISLALNAAFDTPPPEDPKKTKKDYFVPVACAQCHGHDQDDEEGIKGAFPYIKVNYLDSDQWYDMASFGDFPFMENGPFDVLLDGGKDHTSQQYKNAVNVLRKINGLIRQQNSDSSRENGIDRFKIKAVEKWLSVHETNDAPVKPVDRALDLGNGAAVWKNVGDEPRLLALLDRYCFRCHSSIIYNVFDKQGVLDRRNKIINRIQLPSTNKNHMPQGRVLDDPTITEFVKYMQNLK